MMVCHRPGQAYRDQRDHHLNGSKLQRHGGDENVSDVDEIVKTDVRASDKNELRVAGKEPG